MGSFRVLAGAGRKYARFDGSGAEVARVTETLSVFSKSRDLDAFLDATRNLVLSQQFKDCADDRWAPMSETEDMSEQSSVVYRYGYVSTLGDQQQLFEVVAIRQGLGYAIISVTSDANAATRLFLENIVSLADRKLAAAQQ